MLLVLQNPLEEAYRFPGDRCPTGANIWEKMSYEGRCSKETDVQGQVS